MLHQRSLNQNVLKELGNSEVRRLLHRSINFKVKTTPIRKKISAPDAFGPITILTSSLTERLSGVSTFCMGIQLWFSKGSQGKKNPYPRTMPENNFLESHLFCWVRVYSEGWWCHELPLAGLPALWGWNNTLFLFISLGLALCLVQRTNFKDKSWLNICRMNAIQRVSASRHSIPLGGGPSDAFFAIQQCLPHSWQSGSIQQVQLIVGLRTLVLKRPFSTPN